jgi:hypothetical protein
MTSSRRSITTTVLGAGAAALLVSGCGDLIERATEEAVEEVVERAAESEGAGNVEVDINDDGISIESDEGDLTIQADENGVQIDGQDADGNDFSLDADEDGLNAQSDDGSVQVDADGSFTATDADGDVTTGEASVDDDGFDVTIEDEDGESTFSTGEGIPDDWPDDIPEPQGLEDTVNQVTASPEASSYVVAGTTGSSAQDAYEDYVSELEDAGFINDSSFNQGDAYSGTFTRDGITISVTTQSRGNGTDMVVTVF